MTGQLRIARWLVDPRRPIEPAHAFAEGDRIPFRGLCGDGRWTVQLEPAEAPAVLCAPCREIVAGAAFRSLEEIAELEQSGPVITRVGVA